MSIIFIFIDGVGFGENNAEINPFKADIYPGLNRLLKESRVFSADAELGVNGLPQSATGQTAIFTGVNAPEKIGKHLSGRPTESLRKIIEENNIFKELQSRGLKVNFANVYRDEYIKGINNIKSRLDCPSVTTVMALSAGLELKNVEDLNNRKGIYHDITGNILKESGYKPEIITPKAAAERLIALSREYALTLFEHFISDTIGHKGTMEEAVREVKLLDEFFTGILDHLDYEKDLLVIASDHGNLEDKSVKTHTRNKVPVIFYGKKAEEAQIDVKSLVDIMPAILRIIDKEKNI